MEHLKRILAVNKEGAMKKFAILCGMRVGSWHLVSKLDNHPMIRCYGEFANRDNGIDFGSGSFRWIISLFTNNYLSNKSIDPDYMESFQKIFSLEYPFEASTSNLDKKTFISHFHKDISQVCAVGYKQMLPYVSPRNYHLFHLLLAHKDIFVFVLKRRNLLRQEISRIISKKTRVYSTTKDVRQEKISVRFKSLHRSVNKQRRLYEATEKLLEDHEVMEIYYEDLLEKEHQTMAHIFGSLQVEPMKTASVTKKINPSPLNDILANYDEVKAYFESKGLGKYFD